MSLDEPVQGGLQAGVKEQGDVAERTDQSSTPASQGPAVKPRRGSDPPATVTCDM